MAWRPARRPQAVARWLQAVVRRAGCGVGASVVCEEPAVAYTEVASADVEVVGGVLGVAAGSKEVAQVLGCGSTTPMAVAASTTGEEGRPVHLQAIHGRCALSLL